MAQLSDRSVQNKLSIEFINFQLKDIVNEFPLLKLTHFFSEEKLSHVILFAYNRYEQEETFNNRIWEVFNSFYIQFPGYSISMSNEEWIICDYEKIDEFECEIELISYHKNVQFEYSDVYLDFNWLNPLRFGILGSPNFFGIGEILNSFDVELVKTYSQNSEIIIQPNSIEIIDLPKDKFNFIDFPITFNEHQVEYISEGENNYALAA